KQKDPHDVDEVPVQTGHFDWHEILGRKSAARSLPQNDEHDADADHHVQRVEASHREIQREENLRLARVFLVEHEVRSRNVMLVKLVCVLHTLDAEEDAAEQDCQNQEYL